MLKEHGDDGLIKKLCIFFSKILKDYENKMEFSQIKSVLCQLISCSIDLAEFIEKFPIVLPTKLIEILRTKINDLRSQLSSGVVKIDFLNLSTKQKAYNLVQSGNIVSQGQIIPTKTLFTPVKRFYGNISNGPNRTSTPTIISVNKKTFNPPAKRKKIDISNQSDTHSELTKLPAIQAYYIGQDSKPKAEGKQSSEVEIKEEIELKPELVVDESKCILNKYYFKNKIMNLMDTEHIENIDLDNVFLFLEKSVEILAEQMLTQAVYYRIHRSNCRTVFTDSNQLYNKLDDNRKRLKDWKNLRILQISNEEREEKNKLYQAKTEEKNQQQKEDLLAILNTQKMDRSNMVLKAMLGTKKPLSDAEPKTMTFTKKSITAKDFVFVLRRRIELQKLPAYKFLLNALNK